MEGLNGIMCIAVALVQENMSKRNPSPKRKSSQNKQWNRTPNRSTKRRPDINENSQTVEGRHAVREAILAGTRRVREVHMSEGLDSASVIDDIANLSQELRIPLRKHGKPNSNL